MGLKAGAIGPVTEVIMPILNVFTSAAADFTIGLTKGNNKRNENKQETTNTDINFFISSSFS
jgi:hypothetical protein